MSSVAKTRCSTCERLVLLALGLVASPAGAVELWPSLRLGGGYLDNPFFDDDTLRAASPIAGPVGFAAPAFSVRLEPGDHQLDARLGGRFTAYGGDAEALARHGHLQLAWRWPREGAVNLEVEALGRHDGIDRFPADSRNGGRVEVGLGWRPTERLRLRPVAGMAARVYPERELASGEDQRDFVFDGGLGLSAGPFFAGTVISGLYAEIGASRVHTNADGLEREGLQGALSWTGHWETWRSSVSAFGWLDHYANRLDQGGQVTAGVGRTLWPGVVVGLETHALAAGSEVAEGRYRQWGGLVVLDLSTDFEVETAAERRPGVERLADGRWRFTIAAPGAQRVYLVGDFNDWRVGRHPLERLDGGDLWETTVALPPGQHGWMFWMDGAFVTPPFEPTRDDGFGRRVGVIRVPVRAGR